VNHLKIGVIGVGRMGQHHCRVYSSLRQVQLVGVYDIDLQVGLDISKRYDIPAFNQLDELLEQVDAVSIASPTPTHFDLVMRCLDRGIHVLVEKPLTDSLAQAEHLIRAADQSGLVIQVGHIERFNPPYQELKNVLENMDVLAVNFRRLSPFQGSNTDVDVILDLMVHDLDLSLDLMKREPDLVSAYGLMPMSASLDHVVAELWYQQGQLITLTASRITEQKVRSVEVTTKEAYLEVDLLHKAILVHRRSTGEYSDQNHGGVKYRQESIIERILVPAAEPLMLEVQHFLQCIDQNCPPRVTLEDGYKSLRLALLIRNIVTEHNFHLTAQLKNEYIDHNPVL